MFYIQPKLEAVSPTLKKMPFCQKILICTILQCANLRFVLHSMENSDFFYHSDLREIKVGWSSGSKSAIATHLQTHNFDSKEFLQFLKAQINKINQIHYPENGKKGIFRTSRYSRIDFTQNLSDRKIMKFPHCALPVRFYVKSILANSTLDCQYLKLKFFH